MLPTPAKYFVTAAAAEGSSRLNAFDHALLEARIGDANLVRISSILPAGAVYDPQLELPPGALVPTAYGIIISDTPGQQIAAAVGVIVSENSIGVIMEYAGKCSQQEAHDMVYKMLEEAFQTRGLTAVDKKIAAVGHQVECFGCCVAAVPLWY